MRSLFTMLENKARMLEPRANARGKGEIPRLGEKGPQGREVAAKHSGFTHSQISAKEEGGTVHPPTNALKIRGVSLLPCSISSEGARSTLP